MKVSHWTTNKPTNPGWYWWRNGYYRASPVLLERNGPDELYCSSSDIDELYESAGEWSSEPIAEPEECA